MGSGEDDQETIAGEGRIAKHDHASVGTSSDHAEVSHRGDVKAGSVHSDGHRCAKADEDGVDAHSCSDNSRVEDACAPSEDDNGHSDVDACSKNNDHSDNNNCDKNNHSDNKHSDNNHSEWCGCRWFVLEAYS